MGSLPDPVPVPSATSGQVEQVHGSAPSGAIRPDEVPAPQSRSCCVCSASIARSTDSRGESVASATEAADAAVKSQRNLEGVYRQAACDLLAVTDISVLTARREFYRRISAISDDIVAVADRIWSSRVKES